MTTDAKISNFFTILDDYQITGTRWYATKAFPTGNWIESDSLGNLDEPNHYFSIFTFDGRRSKTNANPSGLLWADFDQGFEKYEQAIKDQLVPKASLLWETSPGKAQAIWLLDTIYDAYEIEAFTQELQLIVGSDETWDAARMLRVPLTLHQKKGKLTRGKIIEPLNLVEYPEVYNLEEFDASIRLAQPEQELDIAVPDWLPQPDYDSVGLEAQKLLLAQQATGQRHRKLYRIACLMAQDKIAPELAIANMRASVWNKFSGRSDELYRLTEIYEKAKIATAGEIGKADKSVSINGLEEEELGEEPSSSAQSTVVLIGDDHSFEIANYRHMLELRHPEGEWLVDNWWPIGAQGLVAGSPKSYKSTILLDMCMSIASGVPFLGNRVNKVGPVLLIQEENDPLYLAELFRRIAVFKGLGLEGGVANNGEIVLTNAPDLPIYTASFTGLNLTKSSNLNVLQQLIDKLNPVIVVLDSLYMLLGRADEDKNTEMRPALAGLTKIRAETGVAIAVIHHYRKAQPDFTPPRAGDNIRGAGSFHAWEEVGWYITRQNDVQPKVSLTREFRMAPNEPATTLVVAQGGNRYALLEKPKLLDIAKNLFEYGETVFESKFNEIMSRLSTSEAQLLILKEKLINEKYLELV